MWSYFLPPPEPVIPPAALSGTTTPDYSENTFTVTWAAGLTTQPTATARYTKIGNAISITVAAQLTGTSNGAASTITGMPVSLLPSGGPSYHHITAKNGSSASAPGRLQINEADGSWAVQSTLDGANFTNANTAIVNPFSLSFSQ